MINGDGPHDGDEDDDTVDNLTMFPGTVADVFSHFTPAKIQEVSAAVLIWEEDGNWYISCSRMDIKELTYTARLLDRLVDQVIDSV